MSVMFLLRTSIWKDFSMRMTVSSSFLASSKLSRVTEHLYFNLANIHCAIVGLSISIKFCSEVDDFLKEARPGTVRFIDSATSSYYKILVKPIKFPSYDEEIWGDFKEATLNQRNLILVARTLDVLGESIKALQHLGEITLYLHVHVNIQQGNDIPENIITMVIFVLMSHVILQRQVVALHKQLGTSQKIVNRIVLSDVSKFSSAIPSSRNDPLENQLQLPAVPCRPSFDAEFLPGRLRETTHSTLMVELYLQEQNLWRSECHEILKNRLLDLSITTIKQFDAEWNENIEPRLVCFLITELW